jgi:DNA-binding NarL/FixJ family response regulator
MSEPDDDRAAVRVAVVDDHEATRDGLVIKLDQSDGLRPVGAYADVEALIAGDRMADVVVLDLYQERDGQTSIPHIGRLLERGARVVLYTREEAPVPLRDAVAAGAAGICLKFDGVAALIGAIREVAAGETAYSSAVAAALIEDHELIAKLTDRERDILRHLNDGLNYRQIGALLSIKEGTVKDYMKKIRAKYSKVGCTPGDVLQRAHAEGYIRTNPIRPQLPER